MLRPPLKRRKFRDRVGVKKDRLVTKIPSIQGFIPCGRRYAGESPAWLSQFICTQQAHCGVGGGRGGEE